MKQASKGQAKKTLLLGLSTLSPSIFLTILFLANTFHADASLFSWFSNGLATDATAAETDNTLNSQTMPLLQAPLNPLLNQTKGTTQIAMVSGTALLPEAGPIGTSADIDDRASGEISLYIVHKGDTISAVAKMFGVSVNTIMWGNDLKSAVLYEGEQLVILPISGVKHVVKAGDTIESIAKKYKGDVKEILQFNDLTVGEKLAVGDVVIVPDGEMATPPIIKRPTFGTNPAHDVSSLDLGTYFGRPLSVYNKTQGLHGYNAVDLAAPKGSPIYASAAGEVIVSRNSGWNGGYGEYIVISHDVGAQTLYAHASQVLTFVGMHVEKGQLIGYVGATGKATGPHLHFEVRGAKNPF